MNEFLQHKEKWLVAVAANIHEWFPVAVAVALARYFNSKTEVAFPSVDTLAAELNTDRRKSSSRSGVGDGDCGARRFYLQCIGIGVNAFGHARP